MVLKTWCLVAAIVAIGAPSFALDEEGPRDFPLVLGPRIGCSYVIQSPEEFTASLRELYATGE